MNLLTYYVSNKGGRYKNEDCGNYVYEPGKFGCFVVADGLGAHEGGEVAAGIAVECVLSRFIEYPLLYEDGVLDCFRHANDRIINNQKKDRRLFSMRTTAVALFTDCSNVIWAHIGDSRLYRFRNGMIDFQTKDHSVSEAAVRAGEITPDQIRFHEDRSRLLRVLGSDENPDVEILKQPQQLERGDAFLLCTDGFWEYVLEDEMEADLAISRSPEAWLRHMTERLIKRVDGNNDNYTSIAVFVL